MLGASGQMNPPTIDLDEKQDVQGFETYRLNGEEIASKDLVFVVGDEVAP